MKKPFRRHFRIYFRNNHPAYIVEEEGDCFVFHRTTESITSGGKKNWKIDYNPWEKHNGRQLYMVKAEQKDHKRRFSPFELDIRNGADISYPHIKLKKDIKK